MADVAEHFPPKLGGLGGPPPFVSVVTPTFKREDLLAQCVESVLAQQWDGDCEVTVVNDAGGTLAPANWQNDPRVRVVTTHGTERSVARNTGAALSRGAWLFFLDDDDYVLPGAFAALAAVAGETDADLVYGGYRTENSTTGESIVHQPEVAGDVFALFFAGEMLPIPALWVRHSAFWASGGFDPLLSIAEDLDLLRRVSWGGTVSGTSFVTGVARVEHSTSTTQWARYRENAAMSRAKCLARRGVIPRLLQSTGGAGVLAGTVRAGVGRGRDGKQSGGRGASVGRAVGTERVLAGPAAFA